MENYLEQITELLEEDNVNITDELSSFEAWDSLTILSIIAMAGDNYNVVITAKDVNEAKTIGGLYELIMSKK